MMINNMAAMYFYLIFILLSLKGNGNIILPPNTIQIPSTRLYNNFIRSERHYVKQQQPLMYLLHGPSSTFIKLSGLTMPFFHTEPLLYKIRFEGNCYSPHSAPGAAWLFFHLMVDDYILYVNKFLPNTANRYQYLPDCTTLNACDRIGGFHSYSTSPTTSGCSFSDTIYLNPGLHVIDVGVRGGSDAGTGVFPIDVQGGILRIELIEYDDPADVGMSPVNVTLTTFMG